jgi:hypothetical protein
MNPHRNSKTLAKAMLGSGWLLVQQIIYNQMPAV